MKQYSEAERAALIEGCHAEIKLCTEWRERVRTMSYCGLKADSLEYWEGRIARAEIALAALTAEPVGYIHNFLNPDKNGGSGISAEEDRHYGRAVYTTPPVAAMRQINPPRIEDLHGFPESGNRVNEMWREAIRDAGYEVATAPAEGKK